MKQKIRVYAVALTDEVSQEFSGVFTLGLLMSYAKSYKEGALLEYFDFEKLTLLELGAVEDKIKELNDGVPTVFLCSCYVWNQSRNIDFAKKVKQILPDSLIVFGGPNIPKDEKKCRKLMQQYHCIDVAARGEGEETLADLLECLAHQHSKSVDKKIRFLDYSDVKGITFKLKDLSLVRTPDRDRLKDFSGLPSPYLTGEYDHWEVKPNIAILETNRGCPFGCTFCDWGGSTASKIHQFDLERVFAEIDYLGEHKIPAVVIADANMGAFGRDVEIIERLVEVKKRTGYPIDVCVFFAKNVTSRVEKIARLLASAGILSEAVASLQTTDPTTLERIKRSNIKESTYVRMIEVFDELKVYPTTDILIGMPGQTYQAFKTDLQFCFDRKIGLRVFRVTILPNSPMADEAYMLENKIEVDFDDKVISTYSASKEDYEDMEKFRLAYAFFVQEKVLSYLLLYLQLEHGIKAMEVIDQWLIASEDESKYPLSNWLSNNILNARDFLGAVTIQWGREAKTIFTQLDVLYKEILSVLEKEFSVVADDKVNELIKFHKYIMPSPHKSFPKEEEFLYDFAGYFDQIALGKISDINKIPESFKPLELFHQKNTVVASLANNKVRKTFAYSKSGNRDGEWPLNIGLTV